MTRIGQAAAWREGQPVTVRRRSPSRAAALSLVTVSVYGFWWWDANRPLRALGRPAGPGRALAAVTVGFAALIPPFLSVHRTATMIAEAQRRAGQADVLSPSAPVAIAAVAAAGAVAWVATALAGLPVWFLIGVIWPLIAMVSAGYMQRELNRAVGQRVPARS